MSTSTFQDIELGELSEQYPATSNPAPEPVPESASPQNPIAGGSSAPVTALIRGDSSSWWRRHIKRNRDTLLDEFEVHLKQKELSEHRDNLLQDYAKIKEYLADGEFIRAFLVFDVFQSPPEAVQTEELAEDGTAVDNPIAFRAQLAAIRSQLSQGQALEGSWGLRLWQVIAWLLLGLSF
jgi:hypothetical protein